MQKLFTASLVILGLTLGSASGEMISPYEAKEIFVNRPNRDDKWLERECLNPLNFDNSCRMGAAMRTVEQYAKGDYQKSRYYLDNFYRLYDANYDYAQVPCPDSVFTPAKPGNKTIYFGYIQAKYALDVAQKRPDVKSSGLKAFLCSLIGGHYKWKVNFSEYRFTRDNFRDYVRANFPGQSDMDPDLFLRDIHANLQPAYDAVTDKIVWGKDWKKDTTVHVKLATLFKNATSRCNELGLSNNYCSFLADMARSERNIAKSLADDGEVE